MSDQVLAQAVVDCMPNGEWMVNVSGTMRLSGEELPARLYFIAGTDDEAARAGIERYVAEMRPPLRFP